MLAEAFNQYVEEHTKTKVWAMGDRESPATPSEIQAWESTHGAILPSEYQQVVGRWGAGDLGLVSLFSVKPGWLSIDAQVALAKGLLPKQFVPISDNGCGDYYGFKVSSGVCEARVYFVDHEAGFTLEPTEFSNLYEYIAHYGF
jgi:hypothetical protein